MIFFSTVCLQISGNKKAKESDDDTNDTPPPAKRGRKPKDATASAASTPNPKESEPTNITSTPKSPRGRKRKTEEKSNEELKRPEESGNYDSSDVCLHFPALNCLHCLFTQINPNLMVWQQELKIETFHACQTSMRLEALNEK